MNFTKRRILLCSLEGALSLVLILNSAVFAQNSNNDCMSPALERFQKHKVAPGETLASIAQQYNLLPDTIITMNPNLNSSRVSVGTELLIPPYNGIVVEVPKGQNWRQIAQKYKIRPDVLFEVNGCQTNPKIVFVPGVDSSGKHIVIKPQNSINQSNGYQLPGYPLPQTATLALLYGWQINPTTGQMFFHSGIDLLAAVGTPVKAVGAGTVVFANNQGSYGKLVIINHDLGLQSRYAHLQTIKVQLGQQVKSGDILGTVGTTGQPDINQPHLLFEIRSSSSLGWVAQDPTLYMK